MLLIKVFGYVNDRIICFWVKINGFLIPSNSKVIFEKLTIDGKELSNKKIKDFENKFSDNVIQNSLVNIFQKNKIDKYFKNLF